MWVFHFNHEPTPDVDKDTQEYDWERRQVSNCLLLFAVLLFVGVLFNMHDMQMVMTLLSYFMILCEAHCFYLDGSALYFNIDTMDIPLTLLGLIATQ